MLSKMEKGGGIKSNTLLEKYDIIKLLGKGLGGKVYLVRHKTLDVYRAVKIVPLKKEAPVVYTKRKPLY